MGRTADDPFDLQRFVRSQEGVYESALAELRNGHKRGHWMWFVFPQMAGLGRSMAARDYAISGLAEARAYLAHPVLGPRLLQCAAALLAVEGRSAFAILGTPDDLKLRSSMTLFACADASTAAFGDVLAKYYGGSPDVRTLELLEAASDA